MSYIYGAWGKPTITNVAGTTESANLITRNPYLYRGYRYDHETGLYYLNSRYYDPETGRFVNADVMVSTNQGIHSTNMFAYCENDPINCIDPSGYFACLQTNISTIMSDGGSCGGTGGGGGGDVLLTLGIITIGYGLLLPFLRNLPLPISPPRAKTKEKTDEKTESERINYWQADLVKINSKKEVIVSTPLTFKEACERVSRGGSIMCRNQESALAVIRTNGYHNWIGPEMGRMSGAYPHYHPTRNHKGYDSIHIWFYE